MKKICLFFVMVIVCSVTSFAQFSVKGLVVDKKSSENLPFVNVALLRTYDSLFVRGASSNLKGDFLIHDVDSGQYFLQVKSVGYREILQPIVITGDTNIGEIVLERGTLLKEVEIVSERPLFVMDGEKNMYNVSEDPSIQTGTISDALQNAPDVEVDVEGNIKVRGVASVEVWINDKPSHMSEEVLKQYIKNMPANSVERIDVITNPSARYKTSGAVINIVTNQNVKRNEFISFGLNGNSRPRFSPWVSYVYANEKLNMNLYLNGTYADNSYTNETSGIIFTSNRDTSQIEKTSSTNDKRELDGDFNFNINYAIDSVNEIGGLLGIWATGAKMKSGIVTERREFYDETHYNSFLGNTKQDNQIQNGLVSANMWYTHIFDSLGKSLQVNLEGTLSNFNEHIDFERAFIPVSPLNAMIDKSNSSKWHYSTISADYHHPYNEKGEVDFGISGAIEKESNIIDVNLFDSISKQFLFDDSLSIAQIGKGQELNAYVTWQQRFGGFTLKLGLRADYSHNVLQYPDDYGYDIAKDYLTLVPTIHLTYRTKTMHNFYLDFSRRCQNPEISSLTSIITYNLDDFTLGNPDLLPSYIYRVNGGWSKYIEKFGSIGVRGYYSAMTNEEDNLTDVVYKDYYGRMVCFDKPINIGNSHYMGLSCNVMYRPTGFFNIRFNAYVSDGYFDFEYSPDERYEQSSVSYGFNLGVWAKLFNKLEIHADGYYKSKAQTMFNIEKPMKSINIGINADFFDRKLSAYINVNDIFNWNAYRRERVNPYYYATLNRKYISRYIAVGITFRFGKMELSSYAKEGE